MRSTFLLAATLAASVAHAQPAPATPQNEQPAQRTWQVDVRWAPYLGCWRSEDDLTGTGVRLCFTPENVTGVKLITMVDDEARMTETVIPDKVARPLADHECRGTSRSEWSKNNQRLYRFADVTCGTEPARKLSGVAFLLDGPILVDVQSSDSTDNKSVRVRRFHRAGNQKLPDGSNAPRSADVRGTAVGASWTVEDVIEASSKIPGDAVQAAISEAAVPFRLNKTNLVAMDNAGVSDGVIDLMVALSYPKRFVVERATPRAEDMSLGAASLGWWDPFLAPMIPLSMLGRDCYSAYAYGLSYACGPLFSSFGYFGNFYYPYSYYSYNPYYPNGYNGGWVVVDSGSSNLQPSTAPSEIGSGLGRVVNGHGYTQIRNREPIPSPDGPRSGFGGDSSSTSGSSGTNSTGSSGVSSGGYSGGGAAGDSGRTAVPRGPGGQ